MYPRIIIDKQKLKENIERMVNLADANGIPNFTFVVKAFAGDVELMKTIAETEISSIGDSRIQNLKKFSDIKITKMLLRVPMLSEVADVVKYSDISLNSEIETIKALNIEAAKQNKKHDIIIMFDLGDLREGIYYNSDYLSTIKEILSYKNIRIMGIGTNLTCYGVLVPSSTVLERLVNVKKNIEKNLSIKIKIMSGGNSSTVTLFNQEEIPNEINHLRLGESILFGKETSYSTEIEGFNHDIFIFEAEIVELKEKPSYPDGKTSINSFGEVPKIEDLGIIRRAILGIGKQDVILENLTPIDKNIEVLGGSSDHLIVHIKSDLYKVGDIISFKINYPGLVHLMNSGYVEKIYK